jgi:hypothetical protein
MTSMFQFCLINDKTGDMWQFQWRTNDYENRWIKKNVKTTQVNV